MNVKDISTLKPAPYNPRTLSQHDGAALEASIKRWGDISGITKNIRTGYTVTGHQRIAILKQAFGADRIKIHTEELAQPDQHGTVATGYVTVEGTDIKLGYREVSWSDEDEKAANIGANRIQGDFALDLLAELNYDLKDSPELLKLTGQTDEEIKQLLDTVGGMGDTPAPHENSLTIRIECESQEQMDQLYTELRDRGLNVRI